MTTSTAPSLLLDDDLQDVLFRSARSVRAFADAPVDDDVVAAVHDLVRWGPTAFNASPLRLLLVRTPEARARLASHMGAPNRQRVLDAPLSIVAAADTGFHHTLGELAPHMAGAAERFEADPESRVRIARDNAWLQAGYLVVGLRAAGLAVGPMSGMDAAGIDADLLAGSGWHALMVLNVGWPTSEDGTHPRGPRLDVERTTRTV